ncbi:hypothetical protein IJ670_01920, partial [bacterium]|nr:hypothetical protein [bacterium]
MSKVTKILIIIALFSMVNSGASFGAFEIYKAKTIVNETLKEPKVQPEEDTSIVPKSDDPVLPQFSEEESVGYKLEEKIKKIFKKKKAKKTGDVELLEDEGDVKEKKSAQEIPEGNKLRINADEMTYDDTTGFVHAKGHVEVVAPAQGTTVKADIATIDKTKQTIKFEKNVKILKNGVEMKGEYLFVNLNEENILMENPVIEAYSFTINAQQAYLIEDDIQMLNGNIRNYNDIVVPLISKGIQNLEPYGPERLYDYSLEKKEDAFQKKNRYSLKAKEIVITSYKDHDSMQVKRATISFNNHKIIPNLDFEIVTDKKHTVADVSMPLFGSMNDFGSYIGYGQVFRLPKGQMFKVIPAAIYKSGFGFGLMGKYQSRNALIEAGMATNKESNIIVRGKYNFGKTLSLVYGKNAYLSEGFYGERRPGYGVQLQSETLFQDKNLGLNYTQGLYAGMYSDYERTTKSPHLYGTSRFRYMGELDKKFFERKNKEQDLAVSFGTRLQGAATVYGSGETQATLRFGPYLRSKVKRWESGVGYLIGGVHGDSPFLFDKYMYGKSSITINEKVNFN